MDEDQLQELVQGELERLAAMYPPPWEDAKSSSEGDGTMRQQIGTVRITRPRIYKLDPWAPDDVHSPATVIVEPGEYPVYQDGLSRYWRMTGVLNHRSVRLGDGMFTMAPGDVPSDDDVVFYSLRYGPDEWEDLLAGFARDAAPALVFTLTAESADNGA